MQRRRLLTLLAFVAISALVALVAAVLYPPLGESGEAPVSGWRLVLAFGGIATVVAIFRHADRVCAAPLTSEARTLALLACLPGVVLDFRSRWPALVTLGAGLLCVVVVLLRRRWRRQLGAIGPKATALGFFALCLAAVLLLPGRRGAGLALLLPAAMVGVDAWKLSCVRALKLLGAIATVAGLVLATLGWVACEGLALDGLLDARPFVMAAVLAVVSLLHPRAHPERMVGLPRGGVPGAGPSG